MSGSPGSSGSNPRKFSEKIALHNQKQAEETRAFDQLMTDLTVSRVQFQKIQQLRLSQNRAQYYGGSLPNVNQIGNASTDFQGTFPSGLDSVRGTRHHGLVERVHRDRNRINSPHCRPIDKHGRQAESSPYGTMYLSPPSDNSWRREQPPWTEEKRPGFRLISQLNRTNSDSALHTSAMSPNPQDPFGRNQQMGRGPPQRNASMNEAEVDNSGDVFSFHSVPNEENLLGVNKPLPKQLWEAKKVDLAGLHAVTHKAIIGFIKVVQEALLTPEADYVMFAVLVGLSSSLSNPSIQASLTNSQLHSSLSNPSIHTSLRLSSLSNPPPTGLASSPRRRPAPISPLTLSPGGDQRRSLGKQLSPTMSPSLSPITQGVALDTSNLPMEPPPPYPLYQQTQQPLQQHQQQQPPPQSHPSIQQSSQHPAVQQRPTGGQQQHQQHQPVSPLQSVPLDFNSSAHNSMGAFFNDPFMELQFSGRQSKCSSYQQDQYNMLENVMSSVAGGFDPSSNLYYSQAALMGLGGSHGNLQDHLQMRPNMLYSNCGGGVPNIILTDDSNPSLSKDISSVLSAVPECFDSEGIFPLEDELRIEPLSLDGLSMLSDPDMVLPDPSVEDSFRSDRL
ncbi:CREB-regulated transcription coactivator 3-like [Sinocyclocheilus grahami]|uniref:CREB-regulated transcription coactivator 3-like n=1 Tax=Sinocyclocheilus grahami TaxID=75366 RepID=UPI0007AD3C85|nr:PREDICTED: CREB-regulated transcription coactivator 3-like [Sinocyclocheilus grahami]